MFQPFPYLLAYVAVLYLRPHEYLPAFSGLPLQPVLMLTAFGCWLARQPRHFEAPQFRLLPALTLAMALSVGFSGWWGGALAVLADFGPVLLLFAMVATTVDSLARLRWMFRVLAVSVTVIAWHGIDQKARGIGWTGAPLSQETRITYIGFLEDPNDLAMALVMVLPVIPWLARGAGRLLRLAWFAAAAAVVYAVYLTNSRGSVLALGAMLLFHGIQRHGALRGLLVMPFIMLPLLALGPSRMAEMSADEESAEGRIDAWYEGFQLLLSRPLFGVGKGQFVDHHGLTAHNSFVLAFAELGLLGYVVWLSIVAVTWLMLRRVAAAPPPTVHTPAWDELRAAALALWNGYLGGLVSAFFLSRSYAVVLYLHIALVVAVFQMARLLQPGMAPVLWSERWGRMTGFSLVSVLVLWVVTRVLLSFT